MDAGELEVFDAGRCTDGYQLGLAVGQRFSETIRSRMQVDLFLQEQLLPFASTAAGKQLLAALQATNRERYPRYWDELVGMADGSGVPLLHVILVNLRKEIRPFIPKKDHERREEEDDDCSDILMVSESTAFAAHNEDANVALLGHTYVVKATSPDGASSFTAYTYAGELPTCAFGFNSNGVVRVLYAPLRPARRTRLDCHDPCCISTCSGLHARLGSAGDRRGRRGGHRPELRVAGPAGGERPRRRDAQGVLAGRLDRALLQPDGRQSPAHRHRRDRLPEPVRRPRDRPGAFLPREHVPPSPSGAGAGRELHEQGEESGAVRDGLQGEGARGARRHGRRQVPDLYDRANAVYSMHRLG
ncbi:uncharacterized protein [Triticum aestivum]|nr:uncharacterized protein LOC123077810 isoform X1 [Triticum aestivum]XP_044356073.1 uncharacterized protein LOC123077810 isoform X1 [Triticum aestivum]XP_044356074.1 uncharacterized protein LOC123077810 isoform X1 [Triticum aestivum]